jgi:hypothetical protein
MKSCHVICVCIVTHLILSREGIAGFINHHVVPTKLARARACVCVCVCVVFVVCGVVVCV